MIFDIKRVIAWNECIQLRVNYSANRIDIVQQ